MSESIFIGLGAPEKDGGIAQMLNLRRRRVRLRTRGELPEAQPERV